MKMCFTFSSKCSVSVTTERGVFFSVCLPQATKISEGITSWVSLFLFSFTCTGTLVMVTFASFRISALREAIFSAPRCSRSVITAQPIEECFFTSQYSPMCSSGIFLDSLDIPLESPPFISPLSTDVLISLSTSPLSESLSMFWPPCCGRVGRGGWAPMSPWCPGFPPPRGAPWGRPTYFAPMGSPPTCCPPPPIVALMLCVPCCCCC